MSDPENAKLMWGFLFEMGRFVQKLSPEEYTEGVRTIRTNTFTMHILESASGLIFMLNSDNHVTKDMRPHLMHVYKNLYVEMVSKNPLTDPEGKITNKVRLVF